jgi:dihydroxyacid dehydratase/phosphogluconate dehydratase
VLHVAPEAAVGGPLAIVQDGDRIALSVSKKRIDLRVEDNEMQRRLATWSPPPVPARGYAKQRHRAPALLKRNARLHPELLR